MDFSSPVQSEIVGPVAGDWYAGDYSELIDKFTEQVERSVRAPDYCFRISETRKFFVEAKRSSVDISREIAPAFQLRRYFGTEEEIALVEGATT